MVLTRPKSMGAGTGCYPTGGLRCIARGMLSMACGDTSQGARGSGLLAGELLGLGVLLRLWVVLNLNMWLRLAERGSCGALI